MPPAGSAAQEGKEHPRRECGSGGSLPEYSHEHLLGDDEIECDVLVTGSSKEARQEILRLVEAAGLTVGMQVRSKIPLWSKGSRVF